MSRSRPVSFAFALLLASQVAVGAACSRSKTDDTAANPAPHDAVLSGQQIYAQQCRSCHGARGEGGTGPSLRDEAKSQVDLAAFIDAQMPLGDPDKCRGQCAQDVAAYVLATFKGAIVCGAPVPTARGLRLLTRREYKATIFDLLGVDLGGAAAPASPPPVPCGTHAFHYDPKGRALTTVHVAGSFNGWPQTIAAGGWPLAQAGGVWTLTKQLPVGHDTYKLVLNESEWLTDPENPQTTPDGVGGNNSVIDVTCPSGGGGSDGGAGAGTIDLTAGFPPETRPEGFVFDDNGPGRVVDSVHADEYLRAAVGLAGLADAAKLVACASPGDAASCADDAVRALGLRAFRRPLTAAEATRYEALALASAGDLVKGMRTAAAAMLTSPGFLYRTEVGEKQPDGTYRLTPWEVASALSYGLWGTMPDAPLFDAAQNGALATPAQIEAQARRLLASPRARAAIQTFAEQWLGAENVPLVDKSDAYPDFDADVRAAMLEETRRVVADVVLDGSHKADDLFVANYTFMNERLAAHYGVPGVTGADFRRVTYGDDARAGVLGHGSVLATTGLSDQTSPIRRGLFVRRRLLCQEFAPPPPNAGGVPKVDPSATTRERFAQHTANPFCKSCHQYIDDLGFGFERFDTVGRARTQEAGKPIDTTGDMNDVEGFGKGTHAPFTTLGALGKTLAASDAAKTCVARQYYRFARGRLDDDICDSSDAKARFVAAGGDLRELIVGVYTSRDFTVRR